MITTGAVHDDLIEQFKDDVRQFDAVERVTSKSGQRAVKVTVRKNDDGGVPKVHRELGELSANVVKCDHYVISRLAGGGSLPGDKHAIHLAVSPYCQKCWDAPQDGVHDDDDRCKDCRHGDNLLEAKPGVTVLVEAGDQAVGYRADPGDVIEATADDDGFVRDDDGVFNDERFEIIGRKI